MKTEYRRDMNHTYLMIADEKAETTSYETRMFLACRIPGLLPCKAEHIDNRQYFCYDVTSKQTLADHCSGRELKGGELRMILSDMLKGISGLEDFLLSPDHILLLPDQIFLNPSGGGTGLIFLPSAVQDFRKGFRQLMEFLLQKIDREDQEAVIFGYRFFRKSMEEEIRLEELLSFAEGSRTLPGELPREETIDGLPEDSADACRTADAHTAGEGPVRKGRTYLLAGGIFLVFLTVFLLRHADLPLPSDPAVLFGIGLCASAGGVLFGIWLKKRKKESLGREENAFVQTEVFELPEEETTLLDSGNTSLLHRAVLKPEGGSGKEMLSIERDEVLIGKQENLADCVIASPAVSRVHAKISCCGGSWYLSDCNSRNDTYLNGQEIYGEKKVLLHENDLLRFADAEYRFLP